MSFFKKLFSKFVVFWGGIVLICEGCSSANSAIPLRVPATALENAIQEAKDDPIFQNDASIPQEWWRLFNDPQLNEFIQKALDRNPTLQIAKTKILAASYDAAHIRASLYPYLSWGADVSRQKLSETGVVPFGSSNSGVPMIDVPVTPNASGGIPKYFTLYETELNLQYTFDFWEKNRNTLRAALGQIQANRAEEAFARLQLGIAVAEVYYELQINYKRQDIAKSFVENRQQYAYLVRKRLAAHLDNELALQTAEFDLSEARDILLQIQGQIAVDEYRLMALMAGDFEEDIRPADVAPQSLPRIPLPQNLPLHLLAQRPDITAQLWLIESSGRLIDVAKAGFYPDFNLTAFFGFQTIHFKDLFKWPSRYFNVDPAVSLPIFDAGRLLATLHSSEVNYDFAILEYNRLVIEAAEKVLEALAILRNSWQRLNEFEQKLEVQTKLYRLTNLRVLHSLSDSLDALTSEGNKLAAENQETLALGKTIQAMLELIKALGGGYDNCEV